MVYKGRKRVYQATKLDGTATATRIQLDYILKTTQVTIFNNEPIRWIPQDHIIAYKRDIAWHLFELTRAINMECWRIIVDLLFEIHSKTIFSLIYQLSQSYHRSTLSCITSTWETRRILKKLSTLFNTHILLYKPNYIPQYIKVKTHYLNLIMAPPTNKIEKTLLIYSEPIEYLCSRNFEFQLGTLLDPRFEENIETFFDMSQCIINIASFDKMGKFDPSNEKIRGQLFRQKFNRDRCNQRYKAFIALRCDYEDSNDFPKAWWPFLDDRPLAIHEFILLLIKLSTSHAGTVIILYKDNYYCICGDNLELVELTVCQMNDQGLLTIPSDLSFDSFQSTYQRQPLISLYNNKSLFVY